MSQFARYLGGLCFAAVATVIHHEMITVPASPSNYQVACEKLGLNHEKQEALLEIFNIAGYLTPEAFWKALYSSKVFPNPEEAFKKYALVLEIAQSGKDPKDFNTQFTIDNLFGKSQPHFWELFRHNTGANDAAKMMLYIAQTAFDRKAGQERDKLNAQNWMEQHRDTYIESAKKLGLIDPIRPDFALNYDLAMVFGASRIGLYTRLMELQHYIDKGLKAGEISVLAGNRPLWAEIDGISRELLARLEEARSNGQSMDELDVTWQSNADSLRTEEGKNYIQRLAAELNIALNPEAPFVNKEGKTIPNSPEANKLTETAMSLDLLELFGIKTQIIDTQGEKGARPDTLSTAKDQAQKFIAAIRSGQYGDQKEFHILAISNNPFVERQTIAAQRVFDDMLRDQGLDEYRIFLHGVGFGCKVELPFVHSELGALVSEWFKSAYPNVDTEHLMFQTRDNATDAPQMPLIGE